MDLKVKNHSGRGPHTVVSKSCQEQTREETKHPRVPLDLWFWSITHDWRKPKHRRPDSLLSLPQLNLSDCLLRRSLEPRTSFTKLVSSTKGKSSTSISKPLLKKNLLGKPCWQECKRIRAIQDLFGLDRRKAEGGGKDRWAVRVRTRESFRRKSQTKEAQLPTISAWSHSLCSSYSPCLCWYFPLYCLHCRLHLPCCYYFL